MRLGEGSVVLAAAACWLGVRLGPQVADSVDLADGIGLLGLMALLGLVMLGVRQVSKRRTGMGGHRAAMFLVAGALAAGTCAGWWADRSYQPLVAGRFDGTVEVVRDPEPAGVGRWRAEVRFESGERLQAEAWGRSADALSRTRPGDRLQATGRIQPVGERPWLRTQHIVGRLVVDTADPLTQRCDPVSCVVEWSRTLVTQGARSLDSRPQALYNGLVLGDDRFQPLGQRLRFRQAGLTHLLAVSGQNVAFVLAVARPLLGSAGHRWRLPLTLAVLCLFALATRLEPSVLRASCSAAVAYWAVWSGRTAGGTVALALAVSGLLLLDPSLAESVGFQLSVAASAGILILGPAIERRLPLPPAVAAPIAVTTAAQAAVTPILAAHFGSPSLVALPANLAAGWAAGAVMTWGLTGGVVAGLLPDAVGWWVQAPARLLLWWLESVAAVGASVPAPSPGLAGWAGLTALAVVLRRSTGQLRIGLLVAGLTLLLAAVPTAPRSMTNCGAGFTWIPATRSGSARSPSVLVLDGDARTSGLEDCRALGIRSVDLLITERAGRDRAELVVAAAELLDVAMMWAPPQHSVRGAHRVTDMQRVDVPGGVLVAEPSDDGQGLAVSVRASTG